jgi:hypothetical protein
MSQAAEYQFLMAERTRTSNRIQELAEARGIPGDSIKLDVNVSSGAVTFTMTGTPSDLYTFEVAFVVVSHRGGSDDAPYGETWTRLVRCACLQHAALIGEAMVGEEVAGARLDSVASVTLVE